jgi:hypothetical protein
LLAHSTTLSGVSVPRLPEEADASGFLDCSVDLYSTCSLLAQELLGIPGSSWSTEGPQGPQILAFIVSEIEHVPSQKMDVNRSTYKFLNAD